ncbi:kelch-like protein 10 [Mastacembelus armatus]|uniref:kelch-like protein 10 n=1 Tax=Mastacembelus armatus TaxID=205130 RepID=UPI000E45C58F|nr:kelch-like protein 10 [Mastacembelus armatus]
MSEQGRASTTLNSHRSEMEKRLRDRTLAVFTQFRLEGKLCDVVIKVDDVEFNAHRIILCSCSQYFSTLFTSAWATSTKQMYTITGVSPEMMQLIINYAYTHTVPVTEDNVVEVLAAGDQFLVPGIVQACCFFLEDQLCLRNCIGIWRLVDLYYCPELKHKVFLYILDHFEAIACVSQELLELSVEQLAVIIENDHLNVKQENTVFEAVLHWINHLPDQRRGHMSVLLPKVRLGLMTTGYLKNVIINNAVVNSSSECIAIITEAMTALRDFRDYGPSNSVYRNLLTRPRLPPAILLVIGGKYFNTFRTSLEAYDVRSDRWVTVNADIHRAHHGAAVLDRFVYLIGGSSRGTCLNTVQKFDLVTCTWHQVASMNSRRSCVSVAVQNGCIFAMGGFSRRIYYNTVERYNPEENQWTMMSPMRAKRCGAGAATLNGKVYICGGFNGHRCLSTAEVFDPITNVWTQIFPMRSCRSSLGVAAYRGHIYAAGGTVDETSHMSSVEAYNPQTNRWSPVMSMHSPRSYFGIEVVDDQLVVVGGYNGFSSMPAVERYSDDTRMWYSASNIKTAHCGLSCCVLRGLRNVVEKLFLRDPLTPPNADENQS